ncbi:MAG: ATP-binding protein, partial [Treponema sp.]|nr:ATP-binding protein [Treponema sp.]
LCITITLFSTTRFTKYSEILFTERLNVAVSGLKKNISDCEYDTRTAALIAAKDPEIIRAVQEHDSEKIIKMLNDSVDVYHVDFFKVTDRTGIVIGRTFTDLKNDSVSYQKGFQKAISGETYTHFEDGNHIKVSVRTDVPVYDAGGTIIGVMSAGIRFDTSEALDKLKEHYNADFSVFLGETRIATTIRINGNLITGANINPDVAKYVYSENKEYYHDIVISGEKYSAFFLPLVDGDGMIFGVIATAFSDTKLILERNAMQFHIMLFGGLGLAISILILLVISSEILKPIKGLTHLVSEVTNGNMNVDIYRNAITKDEIGELTQDIYSLVDVIKMIINDLSQITTDLDKFGIEDFHIDIQKYQGSYKKITEGIKKLAISISTMRKTMAVMDYLDTMITVVDLDYNLLYVNSNTADTFGMDRENYIGKKCYSAMRNLSEPCSICQLQKLLPQKDEYPFTEYEGLYDEASGKYLGGRAAIIRWVDGTQVFFDSTRDETAKTKNLERLRMATVQAEAASVAKSAFLANMSHEIRTPMNSIMGFAELALTNALSPITREYLHMVMDNAKGLLQIINDILDISKIESGNIELEIIPFDLRELISTCKNIIKPKAIEKNINLQFYAESSIEKMLIGDPTRLRQVLVNLLSNALKFTDSGFIKLSVIVYNETENNIHLRFEVQDSGIGMTEEQIKRIYEPFMQADISTTRKYGGTGLGLAITKNIIDLMGGTLVIKSEPGKGTSVIFELAFDTTDIAEKPIEVADTAIELEKPSFKGEILVCEDNQMNQRVITEHLERVGLDVEIAVNGREGIDKVRSRIEKGQKPFDLILMDIHMPVMDGIDATPKIIEMGTGTPIVAMTANIMVEDRDLYKTIGMSDYLGKPFTSQELWRCLLKFLSPAGMVSIKESEENASNAALLAQLRTDFVTGNQNRFDEIQQALQSDDVKKAHRLAHSLKSNAGLIGKTALRDAAAEIEAALQNGNGHITEEQMAKLAAQLKAVLNELKPYLRSPENPTETEENTNSFDIEKAREIFGKLDPMLKSGTPEVLRMTDELRTIPGSGKLIQDMENFYFNAAKQSMTELMEKLGIGV